MFKVGDKVMVRDDWIKHDWMIPPGTIVAIAYEKNSAIPKVVEVEFEHFNSAWFYVVALKTE